MLQFFSASTSIVNSKRAITECLENAFQGEPDLNCDLIIIYTAMGHNFKVLLSEAHKLSPDARIVGCTCAGVIGKSGPDESLTALAIMVIKGPKNEFEIVYGKPDSFDVSSSYEVASQMAQELKDKNPNINFIHFIPSFLVWFIDKTLEGIKSVFTPDITVFGGISMDNLKYITSFQLFDDQIIEKGAVMIGFADPTLKFISQANHGFDIIEGMPLKVTRSKPNCIYELNNKPAWQTYPEILGFPETVTYTEIVPVALLARELHEDLQEEYGSRYIICGPGIRNEDLSMSVSFTCYDGMNLWLTKRDEKKMFDGVDWMVNNIVKKLNGKKPLAVFHADCVLRGKYSFNRVLKDELIHHLQFPLCKGENIPWIGMYAGGEIAMLGRQSYVHLMTSALFVIYR